MTGTWATGWATGDIVLAAEFAKGVGCISDTTLGVGAASVDITGIVGNYAHLLVVVYARSDTAAFSTNLQTRFNGDTGANYTGVGTSAATSVTATGTNVHGASATAGLFSSVGILIPNYAGSAADKPAVAFGTNADTGGSNLLAGVLGGGIWRNTSAITRITISPAAGNFIIGSRVSLYALGS